eukprot:1137107-Pelagomonas_calceolata.AAC.7
MATRPQRSIYVNLQLSPWHCWLQQLQHLPEITDERGTGLELGRDVALALQLNLRSGCAHGHIPEKVEKTVLASVHLNSTGTCGGLSLLLLPLLAVSVNAWSAEAAK